MKIECSRQLCAKWTDGRTHSVTQSHRSPIPVFLAPERGPGLGVTLCVRPSVRSAQSCLEHSIFIFQPQILHDDFRMTQRALRRHSSCYLLDEFVNAASVIIVLSKFVWYYSIL